MRASTVFTFNKANDNKMLIDNLNILQNRVLAPFKDSPLSKSKRVEFRTDCHLFTDSPIKLIL